MNIDGLGLQVQKPSLNIGQIHDITHQAGHRPGRIDDTVGIFLLAFVEFTEIIAGQKFSKPFDGREGRSNLMRQISEKF